MTSAAPQTPPSFTMVEREVARLAIAGQSDAQIALELDLSEAEVAAQLLHLFTVAGCDSRFQLAALWPLPPKGAAGRQSGSETADLHARIELLILERNAFRARCLELQEIVDYLTGRTAPQTPQTVAETRTAADLRTELNAFRRHLLALQIRREEAPKIRSPEQRSVSQVSSVSNETRETESPSSVSGEIPRSAQSHAGLTLK